MSRLVVPLPEHALVIDCFEPLSAARLERLAAARYEDRPIAGAIRYRENLTLAELAGILATRTPSGTPWGVMTVGEAYTDSMAAPDVAKGTRDGQRAAELLDALGIPPDVDAWLDVEGPKADGDAVALYVNAWHVLMRRWGHLFGAGVATATGLYEGWGIALNSEALYKRLAVPGYWASSPGSTPPAHRGFKLVQLRESVTLGGELVDVDEARADHLGGLCSALFDDAA